MSSVFKKLNLKDQKQLLVIAAPESFLPEVESLQDVQIASAVSQDQTLEHSMPDFVLCFVKDCNDLQTTATRVLPLIKDDVVLWFAYPKKSSKKYRSDITRDNGWQVLGDAGYEAVRQVAIDEDWSALRFRKAESIKQLARAERHAMSALGKQRTRRKT